MFKISYLVAALVVFAAGAYVWKVKHTGLSQAVLTSSAPESVTGELLSPHSVVVEVGREKVTKADLEWEYDLLMTELDDKANLTPIPDLGSRQQDELAPLKKSIISNLIERKLLYAFIQQDRNFTFDDPARYTACLAQWQERVQQDGNLVARPGSKERFKARLCERSLLDQYLKEQILTGIQIDESEVVEYYKNHAVEFKQPELVEIRHLLFAQEAEARKWRSQVNPQNFEEIAKTHSIAAEGKSGGRLGPFAKGSMPSVLEVAFYMRRGEISDVLRSNYGYHIIMLVEKRPKRDLSLEEARERIVRILRRKKEEEAYNAWVERALASITVGAPKMTW